MIDAISVGEQAAVIVEPIQSAGGIIEMPDGYLGRLRKMCDDRGILLVFDEAQTGLGRAGTMFGFEREGVVPDILTLSKTRGGGLPLSAVVVSGHIAENARRHGFSHFTSHAFDPLTAMVGRAVVDVIIGENLAERAAGMGRYLMSRLRELQSRHDVIGDVRGAGLLVGVEFVLDRQTKAPGHELIKFLSQRCYELGLNVNRVGGPHAVWRLAPPLTITRNEIDHAVNIMDHALSESPQ